MQALVYTGPKSLDYRAVADPPSAPGTDLISVEAVGICGSDMHAYLGHDERRPAPLILGHEACGRRSDGRRFAVNPLVTCGRCADCRQGRENICERRQIISMPPREGAFAEQLAMPSGNLVEVPDEISAEKAALCEPLACGYHAVRLARRASETPLEEAICVVYGGGAIGLGAALVLRALQAKEVWIGETNPLRRALLEQEEGLRVFDPLNITAAAVGTSFGRNEAHGPAVSSAHIVVDGVGYEASRKAACATVRPGGVIVHIGLGAAAGGLDVRRMTLQEITFIGTYTYTPADFDETAKLIFSGALGPLAWPELRPLCEGARAFADLAAGAVAAPKIILVP